MPFTPAHPAIVLPFLKIRPERISATALVIGSVAPDFEYFFKMSVSGQHGHTLLGILYFDIPVTITLSFLFHLVIKQNLIANLPKFLQSRFQSMLRFKFVGYFKKHFVVVIISAGIGSFSHIFWDAFTHNDGFFAQRISYYKYVVVPFDGVRYPLFYGLQHISTLVGLTIVVVYILFLKRDRNASFSKPSIIYWLFVLIITWSVLFLRFFFDAESLDLGNFVVTTISAILMAILLSGFVKFNNLVNH
jgi:hypothetical protein